MLSHIIIFVLWLFACEIIKPICVTNVCHASV